MPSTPIKPSLPDFNTAACLITRSISREEASEGGICTVALDLRGVESVNADALACFVALHNRLRASGRQLILCNVGPLAREVLSATGLDEVFDVRLAA